MNNLELEKIKLVLKEIDNLKIEKFELSREGRIFLKRLLVDEEFLIIEINKTEENLFLEKIENIYQKLLNIKNNFDGIKSIADNSNSKDLENIVDKYIFKDLNEIEKEKDDLINKLLTKNN